MIIFPRPIGGGWMKRLFRLFSFWAFMAAAVLFALQAFPPSGIFLMFLGAGVITALLIHAGLIALFVEALTGRVPRILTIVPIALYAGYYALYFKQSFDFSRKVAELKAANPRKPVLAFDPAIHSLVLPNASRELVTDHVIPVAYEANKNSPTGYAALRLFKKEQCALLPPQEEVARRRIYISRFFFAGKLQDHLCLVEMPEVPPHQIVTIARRKEKSEGGLAEEITEITVNNEVKGAFRNATFAHLPLLPMGFAGCALVDHPSAWKCGADFMRVPYDADTVPDGVDRSRYDRPETIMLGIRKYTEAELKNFQGNAENDAALAKVLAGQ